MSQWGTLPGLAAYCAEAVRHAVPDRELQNVSGVVQHELQPAEVRDTAAATESVTDQDDIAALKAHGRDADIENARQKFNEERVHDEMARVRAKFTDQVDTATDVVVRFDFMTSYESRVAIFVISAATLAGWIVLFVQFSNIMTKDASIHRFLDKTPFIWNVAVGSVCLALMSAILAVNTWRIIDVTRQKKKWRIRRKHIVQLFYTEAVVQWINLVFYVVPNIYMLYWPCYFYSGFLNWCGWVRWTCWNTLFMLFLIHAHNGRMLEMRPVPKPYLDGPWHLHWPCLIPWIMLEVPGSIAWLRNTDAFGRGKQLKLYGSKLIPACQHGIPFNNCRPDPTTEINVFVTVGIALLYFIITYALIVWKMQRHKTVSYHIVQAGSLYFRLQLRLRIVVMVFFALCLILLWLVRIQSCASFIFSWLGIMPMQIVMTANAFVWNYICMPHNPQHDAAARRVWEQEFAWTEADKPIKLAAKALTVPGNAKVNKQPIFCFETMMHMLYWSCLVYDHKRATAQTPRKKCSRKASLPVSPEHQPQVYQSERTTLSLETALGLYDLTDSELLWELQLDTRCLMGWSDSKIVLAFRGTASMSNVWSDVQAWRVAHPPLRGHTLCGTRPLVHGGFMKSWLAGGFNTKVINRVMDLVNLRKPGAEPMQIYVAGHSLGGALATLAAYDICAQLQQAGRQDVNVLCYSFGAPRTGNRAFAKDYNRFVPDTWSIINERDVVTRGGKFVFLYKRPGRRVMLNAFGQMMVAPTLLETSVRRSTTGSSMDQHFLTSYYHAALSVVLGQFGIKGFADGPEGIVRLVEASPFIKDLLGRHMGMQLEDMKQFVTLSTQARQQQTLPGSYLPPKGYYRVKTNSRQQLQRQSWLTSSLRTLPSCFGLSSSDQESAAGNLGRASVESDGSTQPSTDMPTVIEVSLLGEELEDASAAGSSQTRSS